MSIMYNIAVDLPDLYLSEPVEKLKLNLTPKEHPIDERVMYWLHECNIDKTIPVGESSNRFVLWLSTIVEYVFGPAHPCYGELRQLLSQEILQRLAL